MEISGNALANQIRPLIRDEVNKLVENGIRPHMAIITLGDEEDWQTYVNQKLKWGEKLGIRVSLISLTNADTDSVVKKIREFNQDEHTHGIIVQRPFSHHIDKEAVIKAIDPLKDIDGFRPDSPFDVPVWLAVKNMLESVSRDYEDSLRTFLQGKDVVVIGKGETAGRPIINGLSDYNARVIPVDSKTANPHELIQQAEIVISCVGKPTIEPEDMREGQVLIGVGIRRENGKLAGDFDNAEAASHNTHFSPTPGGVGPLNLTFLFQNLVQATHFQREIGKN